MNKVFGGNIKRLRLHRKLTQDALGAIAGINPKYLGEIERGEKNPTAVVLYKIAGALKVPVCKIMQDANCPYEH